MIYEIMFTFYIGIYLPYCVLKVCICIEINSFNADSGDHLGLDSWVWTTKGNDHSSEVVDIGE